MKLHDAVLIAAFFASALCAPATSLAENAAPDSSDPSRSSAAVSTLSTVPRTGMLNAVSGRLRNGGTVRMNMVVILVDFSDRPADRVTYSPEHYRKLFFSRGVLPTGSLAEYFLENSGGRFILDGKVAGWYTMPQPQATYAGFQQGLGVFPANSQGLARDAVRAADPDVNYALFDNDGPDETSDTIDDDQRVDLLMVVHAGPGGETTSGSNVFRSVGWWLPADEPLDGVNVYEFALGPETGGVGIFAHELAHLLGLIDLYDGTGVTSGLGIWSLMSAGWSLNGTNTPAHLDAYSKAQLGFAPVITVNGNLSDVRIEPVETGGAIYRLDATGFQYFLLENRRRTGFDAALPGEGLLIYHVDPRQPNNKQPGFYRVALEQADGLFQLEQLLGLASVGDAGDPYTSTTPSGGFGRYTTPSSDSNDGIGSGVTVYNIRGPEANGDYLADLRTLKGASVRFAGASPVPEGGTGDDFVEAGDTFDVMPELRVEGGTAHDVRVTLFANDPLGEVLTASKSLGDLTPGLYDVTGLLVRASPQITVNPYNLKLRLEADYRDEIRLNRTFSVPVGTVQGFSATFETGEEGFTHQITRLLKFDLWRMHDNPGNGSARAWRCSDPGDGFRDRVDASLLTPYFIIPPDGRLLFDHLVQVPRDVGNNVVAGGFIEISLNDGPWTHITPETGYDVSYPSFDPQLNGRRIFTGTTNEDRWRSGVLNLSGMTGGARVRFRFFSERVILSGTGWTIDNVRVQSGGTPVRLLEFSARRETGGARVRWSLYSDEILAGLRLLRSAGGGAPLTLADRLAPAAEGDFLDDTAGPEAVTYRLEALRRDGSAEILGTIALEADGAPGLPRLFVHPNPVRGSAVVSFRMDRAGEVNLELFDAAGRRVRAFPTLTFAAGDHEVFWDGRDDQGAAVPAGIYFYRLAGPDRSETRKVVVAR